MVASNLYVYGAAGTNGKAMPAETAKRPSDFHRTWLDTLPEGDPEPSLDELMTRQELVEKLRANGIPVSETDIVFWEKRGVLPRAIRRHRDGAPRALYPKRAYGAIAILRSLQRDGMSLDAITRFLWQWATKTLVFRAPSDEEIRARRGEDPRITEFSAARAAVAEEERRGLPPGTIQSVEVQFFDGDGKVVATERFGHLQMLAETVRWTYRQD
jgi:hypothetical protein